MTMTHKEAMRVAREAVRERLASMSQFLSLEDLYDEQDEIQIRAYIEARGLVLVPKTATEKMQRHGVTGLCNNGLGDVDDSDARECYKAMLAAAPDPFAEDE